MLDYDYSRVLGRMKEQGYTQATFARALGISEPTLNLSLNNKRTFKQDELYRACELLGIQIGNIAEYFFAHKL